MDRSELWKVRVALALLFGFIVSAFMAFSELKYTVWGKPATAQVVETYEVRGGRRSSPQLVVKYQFQEAEDASRSESDRVAIDSPITAGQAVEVQYLAGEAGWSRIAGNRNLGAVIFFLVCLVAAVGFLGKLYLEAREAYTDPRGRRRKAQQRV